MLVAGRGLPRLDGYVAGLAWEKAAARRRTPRDLAGVTGYGWRIVLGRASGAFRPLLRFLLREAVLAGVC